jgi:hypothetical protein
VPGIKGIMLPFTPSLAIQGTGFPLLRHATRDFQCLLIGLCLSPSQSCIMQLWMGGNHATRNPSNTMNQNNLVSLAFAFGDSAPIAVPTPGTASAINRADVNYEGSDALDASSHGGTRLGRQIAKAKRHHVRAAKTRHQADDFARQQSKLHEATPDTLGTGILLYGVDPKPAPQRPVATAIAPLAPIGVPLADRSETLRLHLEAQARVEAAVKAERQAEAIARFRAKAEAEVARKAAAQAKAEAFAKANAIAKAQGHARLEEAFEKQAVVSPTKAWQAWQQAQPEIPAVPSDEAIRKAARKAGQERVKAQLAIAKAETTRRAFLISVAGNPAQFLGFLETGNINMLPSYMRPAWLKYEAKR